MVLALFHGIFAIWFWQGKQLLPFMRVSVITRLLLVCVYWVSAMQAHSSGRDLNLPVSLVDIYIVYLVMQGAIDFIGSMTTAVLLRKNEIPSSRTPIKPVISELNLEVKNRFLFALYMVAIGAWMLSSTDGFLSFFHLPESEFTGWSVNSKSSVPGPIHLTGILIIVLALYNFVAVRYRLVELITAGVRGGLFTSLFVLLLVTSGMLHPITLLLPAVDLISVGAILFIRLKKVLKQ